MNNYRELIFLKELNGVGPARINKVYIPLLLNGIELKCFEEGTIQTVVAEQIETTKFYVNHVIKKLNGVVNNMFCADDGGSGV